MEYKMFRKWAFTPFLTLAWVAARIPRSIHLPSIFTHVLDPHIGTENFPQCSVVMMVIMSGV